MIRFWMVYATGQRGPAYQHSTEESARLEAARLARELKLRVYVLAPVASVVISDPPLAWEDHTADLIPF